MFTDVHGAFTRLDMSRYEFVVSREHMVQQTVFIHSPVMSVETEKKIKIVKEHIRSYPDFPKEGVLFRDIFSVLLKPDIFQTLRELLVEFANKLKNVEDYQYIVGLDARGFLFGPLLALELNLPFIPIRKMGKLPGNTVKTSYKLEYGEATVEIQAGTITPGSKALIVDDLLATGGTLEAARQLVEKVGGKVVACLVVIELEGLKGRTVVKAPTQSIITY